MTSHEQIRLRSAAYVRERPREPTPQSHLHEAAAGDVDRASSLVAVADLLDRFEPGDGGSWDEEFSLLESVHARRLMDVLRSVSSHGLVNPVRLSPPGEHPERVVDGHHRLWAAVMLGVDSVPVTFGYDWEDTVAPAR